MNIEPKNYRAFYKPDQRIYNVWGIKYENAGRTIAIKNDYVTSADIILMESMGKTDIKGREIFEGDIVQIITPKNIFLSHGYDKEAFNGFGYIYYDKEKKKFMWAGFAHGCWPEFSASGKEFLIVGNIFNDTELFLTKDKFNMSEMGYTVGGGYYEWLKNKKDTKRIVLFEKNQYLKLEEKEYIKHLERNKMANSLRNLASQKKQERYKRIYYEMKEKLECKPMVGKELECLIECISNSPSVPSLPNRL